VETLDQGVDAPFDIAAEQHLGIALRAEALAEAFEFGAEPLKTTPVLPSSESMG
jgi:hypothetical protein